MKPLLHSLALTLIPSLIPSLSSQSPMVKISVSKPETKTPEVEYDTVIFKKGMLNNYLVGTTLIPNSYNQMATLGYGLWLDSVKKSDCDRGRGEPKDEFVIQSIQKTDSTLVVNMKITENCCYDFLCDMRVDSNDLLHLMYTGYGSYCACYCCFGLTFYISKIKDPYNDSIKGVMIDNRKESFMKISNR